MKTSQSNCLNVSVSVNKHVRNVFNCKHFGLFFGKYRKLLSALSTILKTDRQRFIWLRNRRNKMFECLGSKKLITFFQFSNRRRWHTSVSHSTLICTTRNPLALLQIPTNYPNFPSSWWKFCPSTPFIGFFTKDIHIFSCQQSQVCLFLYF